MASITSELASMRSDLSDIEGHVDPNRDAYEEVDDPDED
jgi:hypothetical protein